MQTDKSVYLQLDSDQTKKKRRNKQSQILSNKSASDSTVKEANKQVDGQTGKQTSRQATRQSAKQAGKKASRQFSRKDFDPKGSLDTEMFP